MDFEVVSLFAAQRDNLNYFFHLYLRDRNVIADFEWDCDDRARQWKIFHFILFYLLEKN